MTCPESKLASAADRGVLFSSELSQVSVRVYSEISHVELFIAVSGKSIEVMHMGHFLPKKPA